VPGYDTFRTVTDALKFEKMSLDYSDIYTSLQTGVVDGSIGQSANNVYHQYRDAVNHYYKYDLAFEATGFIANNDILSSLSDEDQEIVKKAVEDTSEKSFELVKEEDEEYADKLNESGVEVTSFEE